ncbi:MAG TPA: hypothetical protein VIH17_02465 [Candidatus Acidoferrales bacterium]
MQRKLAVLLAFCLGAGLATAVAQKSKDSTIVDPDVHQVVLENDHIRVLEARAAPGWKSPMHTHPPLVLVSIGSARVKLKTPEGQTQIVDFRPGTVLWRDKPVEHSWELLAGNLHVVAVEVKAAQAAKGN